MLGDKIEKKNKTEKKSRQTHTKFDCFIHKFELMEREKRVNNEKKIKPTFYDLIIFI